VRSTGEEREGESIRAFNSRPPPLLIASADFVNVCFPRDEPRCSGEVWIGGEKAPVTQATCLRLKADTVLTSALWQALSWQDAGSNRFLSRSVRRQTAARLSQEKAVVKPPTLAKRTQWKRLQSLLHISCPAGLIKIAQHGKQFFWVVPVTITTC